MQALSLNFNYNFVRSVTQPLSRCCLDCIKRIKKIWAAITVLLCCCPHTRRGMQPRFIFRGADNLAWFNRSPLQPLSDEERQFRFLQLEERVNAMIVAFGYSAVHNNHHQAPTAADVDFACSLIKEYIEALPAEAKETFDPKNQAKFNPTDPAMFIAVSKLTIKNIVSRDAAPTNANCPTFMKKQLQKLKQFHQQYHAPNNEKILEKADLLSYALAKGPVFNKTLFQAIKKLFPET